MLLRHKPFRVRLHEVAGKCLSTKRVSSDHAMSESSSSSGRVQELAIPEPCDTFDQALDLVDRFPREANHTVAGLYVLETVREAFLVDL